MKSTADAVSASEPALLGGGRKRKNKEVAVQTEHDGQKRGFIVRTLAPDLRRIGCRTEVFGPGRPVPSRRKITVTQRSVNTRAALGSAKQVGFVR